MYRCKEDFSNTAILLSVNISKHSLNPSEDISLISHMFLASALYEVSYSEAGIMIQRTVKSAKFNRSHLTRTLSVCWILSSKYLNILKLRGKCNGAVS